MVFITQKTPSVKIRHQHTVCPDIRPISGPSNKKRPTLQLGGSAPHHNCTVFQQHPTGSVVQQTIMPISHPSRQPKRRPHPKQPCHPCAIIGGHASPYTTASRCPSNCGWIHNSPVLLCSAPSCVSRSHLSSIMCCLPLQSAPFWSISLSFQLFFGQFRASSYRRPLSHYVLSHLHLLPQL